MSFSNPLQDDQAGLNSRYKALRGIAPETKAKILEKICEISLQGIQVVGSIESYLQGFDKNEIDIFIKTYEQVLEERFKSWTS